MPRYFPSLLALLLFGAVLLRPSTAAAQPLTAQNNATVTIETGLDATGDLAESSGGDLTFASDAALTLSGSSQQTVGVGPISVGDLTLDNGNGAVLNSAVDMSGTLTLTSGALTTNGNLTLTSTSETSTAAISGSGSGSVSGDVTFERFLDKSDDASHFRFLSAPTPTLLDDEGGGSNAGNLLSNMWTQSETGTGADAAGDPSVFVYNEAADLDDSNPSLANGWESIGQSNGNWGELNNLTDIDGQTTLDPGRGVLAFLFADLDPPAGDGDEGFPQTLTATGAVQAEETNGSAINPPLTYTGGDGDGVSNNGWNLIANPFMAPIDWESIENDGIDLTNVEGTIYVWDAGAGQYATYTADPSGTGGTTGGSGNQDRYVAPFQAFFVKADGSDPSIGGIKAGDKAAGQSPEVKSKSTATPQVALRLRPESDSTGETTAFRYAEDASTGKDAYDAYQLEPLSTTRTLVASKMSGTDALFDHQNRPAPAEVDTVDLALDITESGTYTLGASALENLPGDWNVVLENTDSGTQYDLDAGESATFEITAPESAPKTSSAGSPAAALKSGGPTVATAKSNSDLPSFRLLVGPSSAIPVELASFDATTNGTEVQLSWQTASETNNAGFAVERQVGGAGGGTWTQVGFVESKASGGTTSEPQRYRFADAEVPFEAENVTYRLRQKDLDGTTTLSDEITAELGAPAAARLHAPFPNPTRQRATLRHEVPEGLRGTTVEIAVYDVLGRRVRTVVRGPAEAGRHEQTLSTRGLSAGTYFVRMRAGDEVQTQRLTVVR